MGDLLDVEACLVENFNDKWIIDSGATNHVCYSLQWFKHSTSIEERQRYLKLGNGEPIFVKAIGLVVLFFEYNRTLCLEDCLSVPDFKRNLVYVSCLVEHGLTLQFNSSVSISKSFFICFDDLMNNLYFLSPLSYDINVIEIVENEHNHLAKKRKVSNETYLWHLRLSHINPNRIHFSYLEGKMTKRPYKANGYRATKPLELVHTDVCGPMRLQAKGGYAYFVTFIDDYSRYGFVYLRRQKSETFNKFREYKAGAEKQLVVHIKQLRSDRGGEYLFGEFKFYLTQKGIVSQLSAPGTPQQNGVAERRNRTLLDMVRLMLSYSSLPISFWGYALETATYLFYLIPFKSVSKTPTELWNEHKPRLNHIRIWGAPAHVLRKEPYKLESRTEVCLFIDTLKEREVDFFIVPHRRKL